MGVVIGTDSTAISMNRNKFWSYWSLHSSSVGLNLNYVVRTTKDFDLTRETAREVTFRSRS